MDIPLAHCLCKDKWVKLKANRATRLQQNFGRFLAHSVNDILKQNHLADKCATLTFRKVLPAVLYDFIATGIRNRRSCYEQPKLDVLQNTFFSEMCSQTHAGLAISMVPK